jgi:Cys-rich protein (TIGR01571 family)
MRTAIRKKYNIPGDACEDVVVVIFLPCCALTQVLLFL